MIEITALLILTCLCLHHGLKLLQLQSLLLELLLLFEIQLPLQGDHVPLDLIILGPVVVSLLVSCLDPAIKLNNL